MGLEGEGEGSFLHLVLGTGGRWWVGGERRAGFFVGRWEGSLVGAADCERLAQSGRSRGC